MENIGLWLQANQWALLPIFVWDISWRMLALWHAARQNQKLWFILLMIINSIGLFPIFYLIFISDQKFWIRETVKKSK